MFSRRQKKLNEDKLSQAQELEQRVSQDLRVHNMPNLANTDSSAKTFSTGRRLELGLDGETSQEARQYQKTGLIIIIGGAILIITLLFLGYQFMIRPALNPPTAPSGQAVVLSKEEIELADREIVEEVPIAEGELELEIVTEEEYFEEEQPEEEVELDIDAEMAEESSLLETYDWPPVLDSDGDGLTDEEELVLGTDPDNEDTNDNGHSDLVEILNNYDPVGTGSLESNQNLEWFINESYNYSLLYPRNWSLVTTNQDSMLFFSLPDESIIQVVVQENQDNGDIITWYGRSFPGEPLSYSRLKVKETWEGIVSDNELNVYLIDTSQQLFITMSYIPSVSTRLAYPNIFKLMWNSLQIN